MKKFAFLCLSLALALAAGCSQMEQDLPAIPAEEEEILVSKSFQAGVAETRTSLDGVKVLFAKDESISIWDGSGNREYKADEAGANVSFSGEVSASATEFFALSPYSASTMFSRSGSTVTAQTTLSSSQEAVPGTFADGLNISAAKSNDEDAFSLENVLSVAKFTLSSANLSGHQIASVELTGSYPLAGDVLVTYGETATAAAGTHTVNTVTLAHADGAALIDGTYYLTLLPNAGGQITLKFTATDGYTATKTATLKSAFEAGSIKNLGTVKGLNWEAPKYYFMPVSEVSEGTYLIVAENEGSLLAAKAVMPSLGNSYGYLKTTDVTEAVDHNGFIMVDNLEDAFVYAKGGETTYTIQQLYDNKYWFQSGNYTSISIADDVSDNSYYTVTRNEDGTFKLLNNTTKRYLQYSTSHGTFGSYTNQSGIVPTLYRLVSDPEAVMSQVTLTTQEATGVTSSSAVLNADYAGMFPVNAVNVGFYYGTSPSELNQTVYDNDSFTASNGSLTVEIASLSEETTYYYRATMQVWDPASKTYKEYLGEIKSFTTLSLIPASKWKGWLELPANTLTADNYIYDEQKVGTARNYTMSYDISTYAAMWVAYPLYSSTMGSTSRPSNWSYNGHFSIDYQVNITKNSYGVEWTESYGNELYARGHQIPNADRNVNSSWQNQTFLVTNSTPQIQNRFNGSIWANLEEAVRTIASATDTVYVVTGPVFRKIGGHETIKTISPQLDPNKNVPVPNYYWKALLKVKWSGKTVTSASAIGFWYEHKSYVNNEKYDDSKFVVSVNDIEDWTGLDLFANLPGDKDSGIEKTVQENTNLQTFRNF